MIKFNCDNELLTKAYEIAYADVSGNINNYKAGVLDTEAPCIMAGGDYDTPWTRDTSINVWNSVALTDPEVAKNTLLSVLKKFGSDSYAIDGEYWDAIIWSIGAEHYINVTHDMEFLKVAENAISNSIKYFEKTEYDEADGLFRGGAVYGDGIAAYPDQYATGAPGSNVMGWLHNPNNTKKGTFPGVGLPMKALSTNCCYYKAYSILAGLKERLGLDFEDVLKKAEAMKCAINKAFWNEKNGTYDYLAYECDVQEALGIAFVLLFGIADKEKASLVLENAKVTKNGIGILWPCFDRYLALGEIGRHSGAIWPHGQSFWARACSQNEYYKGFEYELFLMAEKAVRDGLFYEIYHPETGEIYGGVQEVGSSRIVMHRSCRHQTWSASGYLSLIYYELLGAKIQKDKVTFSPYLPSGVNEATINGFKVGNATFDILITKDGAKGSTTVDTSAEGHYTLHLGA